MKKATIGKKSERSKKQLVPTKKKKSASGIPGKFGGAIDTILEYSNGEFPKEAQRNLLLMTAPVTDKPEIEMDACIVRGSVPAIGSMIMSAGMNDVEFGKIICATALALVHHSQELNDFTVGLSEEIDQQIAEAEAEANASVENADEEE